MPSQIFAVLASVSLVGAGLASATETRAFDALPVLGAAGAGAGAGDLCRVDVNRAGTPGSAAVTRQSVGDECICTITTGPSSNNGSAENIVNALLRDRTCDGAPPPAGDAAQAGGGGGGIIGALAGIVSAGGAAVATSGGDSSG